MKASRKIKNTSYSLVGNMKYIIIISIPIIFFNIIISCISIYNIKFQNQKNIEDIVQIYQDETASKMKAIEHFIQWTVVNDPLIEALESAETEYERCNAITDLRTRVSDTQYATGIEYNYFIYLNDQDIYYNASDMLFPYEDHLQIKQIVKNAANFGDLSQHNFTWQTLETSSNTYLYYLIQYHNRTFFTIIDVTDLLMPLSDINLGKKGFIEMTDEDNNILFSSPSKESYQVRSVFTNFYNLLAFSGKDCSLPFNLYLYYDSFSSYGQLLLIQLFIIVSTLGLSTVLAHFIIHIYIKLIKPLQAFSDTLASLKDSEELINLQSTNIHELEQANLQFKNLLREIKRLKIDIYEKELAKKRFEITFLQNQIRPHFYLNCLTTISSMAQLGNYKDINSMVLFVSRYLRYLFQTDKELVCIEYELAHIKAYTDIQTLRFGAIFNYTCNIRKEDERALIPPLLLITFVENTLKHCHVTDGLLEIILTVTKVSIESADYLQIDIVDSGQGFSPEILDSLSQEKRLDTTTPHIGITNSIQRLSLLYDTNYNISFYNEAVGGAHIQLRIPYKLEEKHNEYLNR